MRGSSVSLCWLVLCSFDYLVVSVFFRPSSFPLACVGLSIGLHGLACSPPVLAFLPLPACC